MQAAVSRRRETLADVSACQMTRYPPGLISALEKLPRRHHGDPLGLDGDGPPVDRAADVRASATTASSARSTSMFDTHPPLEERIALLREL